MLPARRPGGRRRPVGAPTGPWTRTAWRTAAHRARRSRSRGPSLLAADSRHSDALVGRSFPQDRRQPATHPIVGLAAYASSHEPSTRTVTRQTALVSPIAFR